MVDKTDNTMVKTIKGGGGRQTMVDNTDNTMVKRIKGGEGGVDKQWWGGRQTMVDRQHNGQENKGRGGGRWTRQTTQWSRE